ncbi:MAG: hypothetical protein ACR2OO_12765 [Thermomicrobiales bacterium]
MATLLLIHDRLSTTVVLFMAAVGIWGLFSFARGQVLSGSISGGLAIGQGLVVIQAIFGVLLVVEGARPITSVHYLYGITAVIITPFVWSYLKDRHPRQALLFYSLTALFIVGLAIRGVATGR